MSETTIEDSVRRWPSMRFCEGPSVDSATRYDLNANGIGYDSRLIKAGFLLGMPTLSGEPGGRGRVWSDRVLDLPLEIVGIKGHALPRLERVARELMRPENWLEWQLSQDAAPRWFRTYSAPPSALSLDQVHRDPYRRDVWTTTLSAPADPFAVGEPVELGPFTVTNHPTSGTPMRLVLPAAEGETHAPATVRVAKATSGPMLGPAAAVAPTEPATLIASSWGAGAGGQVSDSGYVAGAYRPTTGTLDDWTTVATFAPAGLPYGRWRNLLRLAGSSDTGSVMLRWRVSATGVSSRVHSTPVVVPVRQQQRWVDTGEVPWPLVDGTALGVTSATVLTLEAKRVQTGGELRLDDALTMLPAGPDTTLLRVSPDAVTGASSLVLIDGAARQVAMAAAGAPIRTPGTAGGWPYLSPHDENHLWVAQNLDPTTLSGTHDQIGSTTEVTVTYRPRYLWGV